MKHVFHIRTTFAKTMLLDGIFLACCLQENFQLLPANARNTLGTNCSGSGYEMDWTWNKQHYPSGWDRRNLRPSGGLRPRGTKRRSSGQRPPERRRSVDSEQSSVAQRPWPTLEDGSLISSCFGRFLTDWDPKRRRFQANCLLNYFEIVLLLVLWALGGTCMMISFSYGTLSNYIL